MQVDGVRDRTDPTYDLTPPRTGSAADGAGPAHSTSGTAETGTAETGTAETGAWDRLGATWLPRAPFIVFGAVLAFALALWMAAGRYLWFYLDDWDFLAARRTGNVGDLFRPHNEHWTTVPIIVYRMLFRAYGLNTYVPYRLVGVLVYLALATVVFVIMLRAGVNPWIATVLASRFALYGAGAQNIVRPFQMTFNGALLFGMLHLLLADHDGPFDRRDWLGLLAGLIALMMSGVAVPMVFAVGLVVLWRRGWRLALLHTVPLAACYVVWWLAIGHTGSVLKVGPQPPITASAVVDFVEAGLRGAFSAIGRVQGFGWILGLIFVVGLPVAWVRRGSERGSEPRAARRSRAARDRWSWARAGRRPELAAPVVLVLAAVVFLTVTAFGRASFGADYARIGRYVSITTALVLPAIAVAVDALVFNRRALLIVGIAILVVGIQPSLLRNFGPHDEFLEGDAATRVLMVTLPRDRVAKHVPGDIRPETVLARPVTVAWLLDGVAQGRIPEPKPKQMTVAQQNSNRFRMSFDQRDAPAPTTNCRTLRKTEFVNLVKGDVLGVTDNALFVVPEHRERLAGYALRFLPSAGNAVAVVRKAGVVRLIPATPPYWPRVCLGHA